MIGTEKEKVSIIMPVYNMQSLVEKAIMSVINQVYENWELVVVDDGSTDNSGTICDRYAQMDARIRVIHQRNKGIAGAINTGLANIQGEYVLFIDSDDFIDKKMLQTLVCNAEHYGADIVQCKDYVFANADFTPAADEERECHVEKVFTTTDEILNDFFHQRSMDKSLSKKLYKEELLDGIVNKEGVQMIDVIISPQLLVKCNKYVCLSGEYYFLFSRGDSVSRMRFTQRHWEDMMYADEFYAAFIKQHCPAYLDYIDFRISNTALYTCRMLIRSDTIEDKKNKIKICNARIRKSIALCKKTSYYKSLCIMQQALLSFYGLLPEVFVNLDRLMYWVTKHIKH